MYILASFVKDKVSIGAWIYLWAFYSVPLIYISVFVPVPYCLDDCGFVVENEVRQVDSSSSILLSQYCFGYSSHLFLISSTSGPITSWEIDEETVETVSDFIFLGSKITADGDCSHEITRHLLLGRKVMTNPDSILKSRDITLPTKVHVVKAMVFPAVMYGYESWTIKKAEC